MPSEKDDVVDKDVTRYVKLMLRIIATPEYKRDSERAFEAFLRQYPEKTDAV